MKIKRSTASTKPFIFHQLAIAAKSGYSLAETLAILRQDEELSRAAATIQILGDGVGKGQSLSTAMAEVPREFSEAEVALVRGGEDAGVLPAALKVLAGDFARQAQGKAALYAVLAWPATLAIFLAVVLAMLMVFVIPAFKEVYGSFGAELPWPTLAMLAVSDLFVDYWWIGLALVAVMAAALVSYSPGKRKVANATSALAMRTPVVRTYLVKNFIARLAEVLCAAIEGRLAPGLAASYLAATEANPKFAGWSTQLETSLAQGEALPPALNDIAEMPRRLGLLVELGTHTATLDDSLAHAVELSEVDARHALLRLQKTLWIGAYVLLGTGVGFVVIATYLPIFKMGTL
jgi:type IV pilus assembly protein PilC